MRGCARNANDAVIESDVVLSTGPVPKLGTTGVVGLDLDFPTRKISKNVGDDFCGFFAFMEAAKSWGEGFICAGGKK